MGIKEIDEQHRQLFSLLAAFYTNLQKGAGREVITKMLESARLLARAAPVPTYGMWDFQLGAGTLGGRMVSGSTPGQGCRLTKYLKMKSVSKSCAIPQSHFTDKLIIIPLPGYLERSTH